MTDQPGRVLTPGQRALLDEVLRRGTASFGKLPAAEAPLIKRRRQR